MALLADPAAVVNIMLQVVLPVRAVLAELLFLAAAAAVVQQVVEFDCNALRPPDVDSRTGKVSFRFRDVREGVVMARFGGGVARAWQSPDGTVRIRSE